MIFNQIKRDLNIAYISTHTAPDLYGSFIYVAYMYIHSAQWIDIGIGRFLATWW